MNPWLPTWPSATRHPVVVCLPAAGGDTSSFYAWRRASEDLHVVPLELPGHTGRLREVPLDSVAAMADGLMAALVAQRAREVTLVGTSLGAIVAYETACRSGRDGPVAGVVAVSCPGPSRLVERLRPRGVARSAVTSMFRLRGVPTPQLPPELVGLRLDAWRADMRAARGYRCDAVRLLPVPVHLVVGRADPLLEEEDIGDWARTSDRFSHETVPGGHFHWSADPPTWLTPNGARRGALSEESST